MSVLLLVSACRPPPGAASTPPEPAADRAAATTPAVPPGAPIELRFASASAASSCHMALTAEGSVGSAPDERPGATMFDLRFALVPAADDELGLQLGAMRMSVSMSGRLLTSFAIDAEGVQLGEGDRVEHNRVANDPAARRLVDLLLGAPRAFVRLDERAVPTTSRSEVPKELEALGDQIDGWPMWLLAMPVLPGTARVGQCWTGVRRLAVGANLKPAPEVELRYCLASYDEHTAVIVADGSSEGEFTDLDRKGTAAARWLLHAKATVARAGGRLVESELGGRLDMRTTVQLPVRMRFDGRMTCTAAE